MVKTIELDEIQWGTSPFRSKAYVSLGMVTSPLPPYWFGSTAVMTSSSQPIRWFIQFDISTPLFAFLHHSCVLLFYDHAITILTILTTHIFSYLSLTLPSLSLDSHSFDYPFLSRPCSFLLSLSHFLCNHSIFTNNISLSELLSIMDTLVYIV